MAFVRYIEPKVCITLMLLMLVPGYAFCKSDFSVAYQVDDQIITNYDIDQIRKLSNLLNSSSIERSEVEQIVISNKIKEIYADRLKIVVSNAELNLQVDDFIQSNKITIKELKSLLRSKGIDTETFYNFVKENIRWQKVLDSRFGYKINNLAIKDLMPLTSTPKRIEKEYEFFEIFISNERWDPQNANLIAKRLEIELNNGADFDKAVEKFSSATSKTNKGKVGPIKKSSLSKQFREVLDGLKRNEVSKPFQVNGGLILLKLYRTRSYQTVKTPKLSVTFSVFSESSNKNAACSDEKEIRGPILLSKVEKNIRDILTKLMPGESYKFLDSSGLARTVTLCESFVSDKQSRASSFENIKKNEEAQRLSNALMLELRRNTTVVKK
jgi:parvulin-like peptidyl-prolyl isomerase